MLRSKFRQKASCRQIKPKVGFRKILGHAVAEGVQIPKFVLRHCVALLSRLAIPDCLLSVVLGYTVAEVVQTPEALLRVGVALLCRLAIPGCRLSVVLGHFFFNVTATPE